MAFAHGIKVAISRQLAKIKDLVLRELRANTSPAKASLSLGLGVLVGFSPLYGLQTVLLLLLAFMLRLNRPLALLGGSTTPLPLVPFWVAAGIGTGKLVAPITVVNQLIDAGKAMFPVSALEHAAGAVVDFCRHALPAGALVKIDRQSGSELFAGVVQWAIGSCVFAAVCAVVTVAVTYPLFKRIRDVRRAGASAQQEKDNRI